MKKIIGLLIGLILVGFSAQAAELGVQMHFVDSSGVGKAVGTITASSSPYGVILTPNLSGLEVGAYGFHMHTNPSCMPGEKKGKTVPGLAAGGHFDPAKSGTHLGPYAEGHLGDLPVIYVNKDGKAMVPVLAPRLKISDMKGRSLMIHAGGDSYSDHPHKLGGGGARKICGVIK